MDCFKPANSGRDDGVESAPHAGKAGRLAAHGMVALPKSGD